MIRNRRLLVAVTLAAVLLVPTSPVTSRPLAAPPPGDHPSARPQGDRPEPDAASLAAAVPGGPGFYAQGSHLFRPLYQDSEWDYLAFVELYNPGTYDADYVAPVSLPHGATVSKLVVWYYDEGTIQLSVQLVRQPLAMSDPRNTLAQVYSSGGGYGYTEDASIDYATIDLQNYAYYVNASIPGGQDTSVRIVSFRIDYAYPGYVPLAMKDHSGE